MASALEFPGMPLFIRQLLHNLNLRYSLRFFFWCMFSLYCAMLYPNLRSVNDKRMDNEFRGLNSTWTIYDANSPDNAQLSNVSDSNRFKSKPFKVVHIRNIGEKIEFGCIYHPHERGVVWIKDGQRVQENSLRYITEYHSNSSTLHIEFIREEDIGEYQCLTYKEIHKWKATPGTPQIIFYLKNRQKETEVLFVPCGNVLILTWPNLWMHKKYEVNFAYYINDKLFSKARDIAIHNEGEYIENTVYGFSYIKYTDQILSSQKFCRRNAFMFKSRCVGQDIYGVHSLNYSINLFNETTHTMSVHTMEHWMRYVVVPPCYQHLRQKSLADIIFMSKYFQFREHLAISDCCSYICNQTMYALLSWMNSKIGWSYLISMVVLFLQIGQIENDIVKTEGIFDKLECILDKCMQKHKCFVFCSDEDRNYVHENIINVLKCNGVNVGFSHEMDHLNQIGRTSFENISNILNNYKHIMIYFSDNHAGDVDELKVLHYIFSSNPSRNRLTLIIDSYPFTEPLRDIFHNLYRNCKWITHSSDILQFVRWIPLYMLEENDQDQSKKYNGFALK